jgi:hypothetical protein
MASRSVWVRLDPNCPRPEARTGFTIPNLDSWILDHRNQATVLRHVLTLILDWTAAGAPTTSAVPQMRQFTRWAQYLGGFLAHHGVTGFLANSESTRELDDDAAEQRAFLIHWYELMGERQVTANDLRRSAVADNGPDVWAGTFPTDNNGRLRTVRSLGHHLTGQVGRWRGDIVLRSVSDPSGHGNRYWVERSADFVDPPKQTAETAEPHPTLSDQDEWT